LANCVAFHSEQPLQNKPPWLPTTAELEQLYVETMAHTRTVR
jgi:hypothetical protein